MTGVTLTLCNQEKITNKVLISDWIISECTKRTVNEDEHFVKAQWALCEW